MPQKNSRWWCAQRVRPDLGHYAFAMFPTWGEALQWVLGDQPFAPPGCSYDDHFRVR
jgi:hypothetical protein